MTTIDIGDTIKELLTGRDVTLDGEPMTLRIAFVNALLMHQPGDEKLTAATKVELFSLATRLAQASGAVSLSAKDVELLKVRIGALYSPLVVGQAFLALGSHEGGA